MNKNYSLAIVGATGLVGRTILTLLEEKELPINKVTFFSSSKSAGTKIFFNEKNYIVRELTENSFDENFNFAIFSAGSDVSKKYAPIAASHNTIVIDNSSAFRMEKGVPLIVPEVNPQDLSLNKNIISNPNCSTIQAVLPLKPLDDMYKIKRIVFSTYQAVSGAGKKGIEDLENNIKGLPSKKFPHPIYNNCLPHIDTFNSNGYSKEETKLIEETKKILNNPDLQITATAVRVPVYNCHSESINVEFFNDFDILELKNILSNFENIIVQDDINNNIYPLATNISGKNEVFVGRIRRDYSVPFGINMWVVADNVRKGAATNAVQILELIINSGGAL